MSNSTKIRLNKGTLVSRERHGGIVRLTIDNPPANALSLNLMQSLQDELDTARDEKDVRVVVIAAAGSLFSAGHDLKEMTSHRADCDEGKSFFEHVFAVCSRLMQSIVSLPKPVIAEIDGVATAAGCQLVASCDLAFASDRSKFGVNGIDVGLFCSTPAVAVTRNIGMKRSMQMLMTGEMIDAATAVEYGLVNRAVPRETLRVVVDRCAAAIGSKSPVALKLGKEAVGRQSGLELAAAYQLASRVMVENMLARDSEEGISAFFEKREPRWAKE
jgi:enoyl-CoA hydratase/carnithine racemase